MMAVSIVIPKAIEPFVAELGLGALVALMIWWTKTTCTRATFHAVVSRVKQTITASSDDLFVCKMVDVVLGLQGRLCGA